MGGSATKYVAGAYIDPASYTVCDTPITGHITLSGLVLTITCTAIMSTQYVIIQSLDLTAERLCLAEVDLCGQYATTFVDNGEVVMVHVTPCLTESDSHAYFLIFRRITMTSVNDDVLGLFIAICKEVETNLSIPVVIFTALAIYAVVACLSVSVSLSVTLWKFIDTAKRRIMQTTPHDNIGICLLYTSPSPRDS